MNAQRAFQLAVTALVIAVVSVVFVFMKPQNSAPTHDGVLQKMQKTGKLDVCYAIFPPAVIKDLETGKLSGHDIDALENIAKRANATIEYHEQTFGTMPAAIQSGVCDVGTSLFAQIPRAVAISFTDPVYFAGDSALIRKGDTRFQTVADIDKKGVTVVVANGESGHNYVKDHFHNATIKVIDVESADLSRFLQEVISGSADVGMADSKTIELFAKAHPETVDLFANKSFNLNPTSYGVRQGDPDFLQFMNTSIQYLQVSGEWLEFEKKYDAHWLHDVKNYQVQ